MNKKLHIDIDEEVKKQLDELAISYKNEIN